MWQHKARKKEHKLFNIHIQVETIKNGNSHKVDMQVHLHRLMMDDNDILNKSLSSINLLMKVFLIGLVITYYKHYLRNSLIYEV